jgi:hypothetical protein
MTQREDDIVDSTSEPGRWWLLEALAELCKAVSLLITAMVE